MSYMLILHGPLSPLLLLLVGRKGGAFNARRKHAATRDRLTVIAIVWYKRSGQENWRIPPV